MRQRFRKWMIVVTVAMALGAVPIQAAFAADQPLQPDASKCELCGGAPPHKKCTGSSSQSAVAQPGKQCGW